MSLPLYCKLILLALCLSSAGITSEISVGGNPKHIVTDGVHLYVSYGPYSYRNYISVISVANNEVIKKIAIHDSPQFMMLHGAKLFLGFYDSISMIDTQTLERDSIETPSLSAMMPVGTKLYVANDKDSVVYAIDTKTNARGKSISVGKYPLALALAEHDLYVANSLDGTVTVIDILTEEIKGSPLKVGDYPTAMLASGDRIYVANTRGGTVSVIDTRTRLVKGSPIPAGAEPNPMIVIGSKLYVADRLHDYASVIDIKSDEIVDIIHVGYQPASFAFTNNKLHISNYPDGTITIKDIN